MDSKLESPLRPAIPPKPDKIAPTSPTSSNEPVDDNQHSSTSNSNQAEQLNSSGEVRSPTFQKPFSSLTSHSSKPALPPKPRHSVSLSPPTPSPTSTSKVSPPLLPKGRNSISIANAILAQASASKKFQVNLNQGKALGPDSNANSNDFNSNANNSNGDQSQSQSPVRPTVLQKSGTDHNLNLHSSSSSPFRSTSVPIQPNSRPLSSVGGPRPSSGAFNFPLNHQNLPSPSRGGLGPPPGSGLRGKSASLGRNVAPPTSSSSVSQFFSNKAATLQRIFPLDLSFAKSSKMQVQSQSPSGQSTSPTSQIPTGRGGRPFSSFPHTQFASQSVPMPGSEPPPPPPRLKKKLSPSSPPPVIPDEPVSAIYAEIDKEKKWAARRLKEIEQEKERERKEKEKEREEEEGQGVQASLVIKINRDIEEKVVSVKVQAESESKEKDNPNNAPSQGQCKSAEVKGESESAEAPVRRDFSARSAEAVVVNSWLGNYLKDPVTSERNSTPPPNIPTTVLNFSSTRNNPESESKAFNDEPAKSDRNSANCDTPLSANKSFLFSALSTVNVKVEEEKEEEKASVAAGDQSLLTEINQELESRIEAPKLGQEQEQNQTDGESRAQVAPTTDADHLLASVDSKIQAVVSKLSNLSGSNSSLQSSPKPEPLAEEFQSLTIQEDSVVDKDVLSAMSENNPSRSSSVKRRRSWNCSGDTGSHTSSSSSLTGNPALLDKRNTSVWVDEGDSTGVLGDVDTSDNGIGYNNSSTEDVGTFPSRRKRTMWIFSSFGKASTTTSNSSSNSNSNGSGGKGKRASKERIKSLISGPIIVAPESNQNPQPQVTFQLDSPNPNGKGSPSQSQSQFNRYSIGSIHDSLLESPSSLSLERDSSRGDADSVYSFSSASTLTNPPPPYEEILAALTDPRERKAFYVAREILTSERTFVDVLDLLTVQFPGAVARTEAALKHPIIPPSDMDAILGGLPHLKKVNEELMRDLDERVASWVENPKLADIIVRKGPFLKLYAHYIKNFEKYTAKLDECCDQYPPFQKTLLEFQASEACNKLTLKHYMLKPVQRMPQYQLLLKDYLNNLEESSPDYEDTVKALETVMDVAKHANDAIQMQVNSEKLLQLQNRLAAGAVIMKADRQLLKEGELSKVCRKDLQPRFFALMNDCLMCMTYNVGAGSGRDLKLRHEMPLTGMKVCTSATEDYQFEFGVISKIRSFNLVAKSAREREDWMKALNEAIQDNTRKRLCRTPDGEETLQLGKIAPVWIQDSRVTMCQVCTAEFTVTFRRHHCRACGKVVCGPCSGNQAPLQYLKNDSARVCDECYQYLLEEFDRENLEGTNDGLETSRETIRARFSTPHLSKRYAKLKRQVPSRLEVPANNYGSRISGYLHWRERKAWKRRWFVLTERVLYIYAASEDVVALKSIPVLGWKVEVEKAECMDGGDSNAVFKLSHDGQNTLFFQADCESTAERWVSAMSEAIVLS